MGRWDGYWDGMVGVGRCWMLVLMMSCGQLFIIFDDLWKVVHHF